MLSTWITDAENIRNAAEDKAKEADDKLKVNETLDENVKKIVEANKAIEKVHGGLNSVDKSLGEWKIKAHEVLDGAISHATEVHDSLNPDEKSKDGIGKSIEVINTSSESIKKANITLGAEVGNLQSWRTAAGSVIDKANGKCEEILKKVKTDGDGKIFTEAEKLKTEGTRLLKAASEAKQAVEAQVKSALEAVVKMDTDLKRDLRSVKEMIKDGIGDVIETLRVNELDTLVKVDLGALKRKIEKLKSDVDASKADNGKIVSNILHDLEEAKKPLSKLTDDADANSIVSLTAGLEGKFKEQIQEPLGKAVGEVNQAIDSLYKQFDQDGRQTQSENKVENIFNKIKGKVNKILHGEPAGRGLQGIEKGLIHSYANGFKNFNSIVTGWMEGTLGKGDDKPPKTWLPKYVEERNSKDRGISEADRRRDEILKVRDGIKTAIGSTFEDAIEQAGKLVKNDNKIQTTIASVKQACLHFVNMLDNTLRDEGIGTLSQQIFQNSPEGSGAASLNLHLKYAVEATLLGLSATASQVANEIESILLLEDRVGGKGSGMNIAKALDEAVEETNKLHGQLNQATNSTGQGTSGQNESPAQAVDNKLQAVSRQVTNLEKTFKDNVKWPLAEAVQGLEPAVNKFHSDAEAQIRQAATTAINKAAEQIKEVGGEIKLGKEHNLMEQFHGQFSKITEKETGLESQLKKQVDTHIGEDDQSGGKINIKDTFHSYNSHVKQDSDGLKIGTLKGQSSEGQLPEAIGKIRDEGLASLNIIDASSGSEHINQGTFTEPFNTIQKELKAIKELVDGKDGTMLFDYTDASHKGFKTLLEDIKKMLTDEEAGNLYGLNKGFEAIKTAIDTVQTGTFKQRPTEIGEAIQAIKGELEELRGKLNKQATTKWRHLKDVGLSDTNNNSGLDKIKNELETLKNECSKGYREFHLSV
ncbi:Extracellular matrix-binding ebh, putative [Babesia ovata]|uniref:Extracellular matrix-binding ebh, putative n=1 Tax=Babesia ovata TaxID=189622 RepID=A0A2H6K6Y2_9APIC|nr:Extracellular matrix-binding ebh, putative [Babesia ovata]GBE58739.1 Extracellular matrix-binding ebh, putative [Babesia ovata]